MGRAVPQQPAQEGPGPVSQVSLLWGWGWGWGGGGVFLWCWTQAAATWSLGIHHLKAHCPGALTLFPGLRSHLAHLLPGLPVAPERKPLSPSFQAPRPGPLPQPPAPRPPPVGGDFHRCLFWLVF